MFSLQPTGTLASLVNQAPCLQSLVDLGVQLHVWDRRGKLDLGAKLDFGRDVAPLITFLTDIGVDITAVGKVLQKVASELHPKVRNHGEGPY